MKKIKDILEFFVRYYASTRGVGHTELGRLGWSNSGNGVVVCWGVHHAIDIKTSCPGVETLTLDELEKLLGKREAIIFDNLTLKGIFSSALEEIRDLERRVEALEASIRNPFTGT